MQDKWKYIDEREGEFPEAYLLNYNGNKIRVEICRAKKQVKINAETSDGDVLESSITNGIVIEERNCLTGRKEDLIDEFTALGKVISAIPDGKVIRLIGGNYGVLSEFIGRTSRYTSEDIRLIKRFFRFLVALPALILSEFIYLFKDISEQPRISDLVDAAIIVTGGYLTYLINFNYVFGGLALIIGALASGYIDWLVRKRDPYILKVLVIIVPAFYFMTIGFKYQ